MSRHTEWLSLIEVSGPFLTVPLLEKAFPQGMETIESPRRVRLRSAYDEWCEAVDNQDSLLSDLHIEWIRLVLTELLEYDSYSLISHSESSVPYEITSSEQIGLFRPDWIVKGDQDVIPRLFISVHSPDTSLDTVQHDDGWPNSFIERMTLLCRTTGIRLGLVTNGERWVLINAPVGKTSSHASWYSRIWFQEPITLKAFQSLLGVRRCFGPQEETLGALLEESLKYQDDVTDTLGEQVRRAVEVLIQCLDKADQDRNRELLYEVTTTELYEAGLTVMMRLVFLLCAEERGLLLLGDHFYDQHYAISTLRGQLVEDADRHGPEMLERRYDAWARLLAVSRMVFGGINHESLRMPALGGSLFDPDKFPFLEGRSRGTKWLDSDAQPLPIDNRTVLLLLESLQVLQQHGGALLLSYRALDVEQIGHVYEGLLEQTVTRVSEVTLGLLGSQKAKTPSASLSKLELASSEGEQILLNLLKEITGRSESAIRNAINKPPDETIVSRLLAICGGDVALVKRIQPYMHLLRTDGWTDPIVYLANSFVVTLGVDRRETGTHYTPKILTERIVSTTLEPLVYIGPAEGKQRKNWMLKSSSDLLDLKICDPAMGSGAFLVQACRWLSERLVESWAKEEENGKVVLVNGDTKNELGVHDPMPKDPDERLLLARRLIAERCLYGVDVNPLAVELSKLSIWLITLSKGRPFGFLDHNLRHGDSILGIHNLDQIRFLCVNPNHVHRQLNIFSEKINTLISEAIKLRKDMRKVSIKDVRDVEFMSRLDIVARNKLEVAEFVANAMIREALTSRGNTKVLDNALDSLMNNIEAMIIENPEFSSIKAGDREILAGVTTKFYESRKPFHWPLEFPEVFVQENGGFDAIIGNPPFVGGRRMRGILGDAMMDWLILCWPHASLNADLSAFFYLRAVSLLRRNGGFGLLSTKSIGQSDTARTGLSYIIEQEKCCIFYAQSSFIWPGNASVLAALVIGYKGEWNGTKWLDDAQVSFISPGLDEQSEWGKVEKLKCNTEKSFIGSMLSGKGFVLTQEEAESYLKLREENRLVLLPYLNGEDINTHPYQQSKKWAIDFRDSSLERSEKEWPELLDRVRNLVKPIRDKDRQEAHRKYWWQHARTRPALYKQIENKAEVFVISRVTKYICITKVSSKQVFSDAVCVLDLPSWSNFAALQCSFHELWVRRESSTMKNDIRYTPSDSFDTYPFLHLRDLQLESIGKKYYDFRKAIMISRNEGITAVYNHFHDPSNRADDIERFRELHTEMDKAVAKSYGWGDLDLCHGFYQTKYGTRYTISEKATREILKRLLKLNQEIYISESERVHNVKKEKTSGSKQMKSHVDQLTLFDTDNSVK